MDDEKTYNGYKNYPTWAVKLWLDNDYTTYNYWRNVAKEYKDLSKAHYFLSERLQHEINENSPELKTSMYSDLLSFALQEVDYYEIAQIMLDEAE